MPASEEKRQHFGTDGVRGVANTELTPELALALGAAAAHVLRSSANGESARDTIVVGRDPRLSGDLLGAALMAGLCAEGVDVIDIGVIPTPGVSFAVPATGAVAGVVISASHNPVQDNGIKFFGPDGRKLADATEARIEAAMEAGRNASERPNGAAVGRITRATEPVTQYVEHLRQSLGSVRLDRMRLVLDCAHGSASFIAADLLRSLGAEVVSLFASPDGVNINADCGSLHPEHMAQEVVQRGFDAGLAFDGDADRVILADEKGRIFDGDRILYALGVALKRLGRLPGDVVVGTVMSNLGLEQALAGQNIRFVRAAVGDRYVAAEMTANGAALGGEKSGHILLPHLSPTGDGLLTGLQVLRLCRESGRSLGGWADDVTELPQKLVNVRVREKSGWQTIPEVAQALRNAETRLAGRGRIFVRQSGTEKMIRVMAEGPDAEEVETLVASVADALQKTRGL